MKVEDEALLDENLVKYLDGRSCTSFAQIAAQFELHPNDELEKSIDRLTVRGLIEYEDRREGYRTLRPVKT